jgi:hypothetical protein
VYFIYYCSLLITKSSNKLFIDLSSSVLIIVSELLNSIIW